MTAILCLDEKVTAFLTEEMEKLIISHQNNQ